MEALKHDGEKPRFSLVPQLALDEVIKGFELGARKYGVFNYSEGMDHLRYYDALMRHGRAWLKGEDMDESEVHHVALIACNALMLLDNILTNKGIDNRNKIYQNVQTIQ
jgi:hypothetical protein